MASTIRERDRKWQRNLRVLTAALHRLSIRMREKTMVGSFAVPAAPFSRRAGNSGGSWRGAQRIRECTPADARLDRGFENPQIFPEQISPANQASYPRESLDDQNEFIILALNCSARRDFQTLTVLAFLDDGVIIKTANAIPFFWWKLRAIRQYGRASPVRERR